MLCEKHFKGMEFLWDAFDIVKPIDTNYQLDALEFTFKYGNALLNLGLLKTLIELLGVDADGEGTNRDGLALVFDTIWRCVQVTNASSALNRSTCYVGMLTGYVSNCSESAWRSHKCGIQ